MSETNPLGNIRLTPRETAAWELALGLKLSEFPESYTTALTMWKIRKDRGEALTIDQALDTAWNDIAAEAAPAVDPISPPSQEVRPTDDTSATNG